MSNIQRAQYEAQTAATTAPTVDKADTEDRETCRICEWEIVEATADSEGQEALFCEGACKAWFHRKCLFMPTDHFEQMTNSIDPYVCLLCTTKNQAETIAALQQSVCALTKEVCILKAAMASMQQGPGISVSATGKAADTTWSTVVSRLNDHFIVCSLNNQEPSLPSSHGLPKSQSQFKLQVGRVPPHLSEGTTFRLPVHGRSGGP